MLIKDLPPKIKTHVSILYLKSYSGRKIHEENLFLKTLNEVLRIISTVVKADGKNNKRITGSCILLLVPYCISEKKKLTSELIL